MADISKIRILSDDYDIKDTTARNDISTINSDITNIGLDITDIKGDITDLQNQTNIEIVDEIPATPDTNTQYELIETENTISGDIPTSEYELYNSNMEFNEENIVNNILNVATFNIQNENVPYNLGIAGLEKINKLKHILNYMQASIIGLNETCNGFLFPANKMYNTEFLENVNFGKTITLLTNYFAGNSITSHFYPITSTSTIFSHVGSLEDRYGFLKNVYSINNKTISFYAVHITYENSTVIQQQIDELYSAVNSDTSQYKIIVGDFNIDLLHNSSMLADFIQAGFKQVNAGQYITFPTSNLAMDEIIVSSNINILNSKMLTATEIQNTSDHLPIVAKIQLV